MSTEQRRRQVEVSADVAAPPETIWHLISDLNRMGEWSPECTGISWVGSPPGAGSRVTESWEDKRGGILSVLGRLATGIKDRPAHNEAGMRTTLERLKAAAEAQTR